MGGWAGMGSGREEEGKARLPRWLLVSSTLSFGAR